MKAKKDQDFEEGELPDEDPPSSGAINQSTATPSVDKPSSKFNNQDRSESSGQIIFQTVTQKDYSPERKKKKIHKQQPKVKPKQKQKTQRSSFQKEKKNQKRKSPTPTLALEESPPSKRDYQQPPHPPMPQQFYNPYMYLPPVNNMMPHMYPPHYPQLPYVHPSQQFQYGNALPSMPPMQSMSQMPPVPPNSMGHPHFPMQPPPSMYPGYQQKPMPHMKPPMDPKFEAYKHHQQQYSTHPLHHPQVAQQKYSHQPKIQQPNNYRHLPPPIYHDNQMQNKISHNSQQQINQMAPPPNQSSAPINRPQISEKPKEREKSPIQLARQKKIDFKSQAKKIVKEAMKDLQIEQQEQILEAIRCIIKYSHLSHSLFPNQAAVQSNSSLSCYQNSLAKLQRIINSQSEFELAEVVEYVLKTLQIKQPLLKIKQRILYRKLVSQSEHSMAQKLRIKLQQKVR